MIIYQSFALIFLFTSPIVANYLIKLFGLQDKNIRTADLTLPLLAIELVLVSKKFFIHSLLPHYLALMSGLALILAISLILRPEGFTYPRFRKRFWRLGFFATLIAYLALLVAIFIPNL